MHTLGSTTRSPFLIIEEFISPQTCEEIIGEVDFNGAALDHESNAPLKTVLSNPVSARFLESIWATYTPQISQYYGVEFEGEDSIESVSFEWFPEGHRVAPAAPDGYTLIGKNWTKSSVDDFYAVLFLMDFNDGKSGPFDDLIEVVGGKLEFPFFKFGFNPRAGMLVMWPSAPNFANGTSAVHMGDAYQARFRLTSRTPFKYAPKDFPGTYQDWF